MKFNMSKPDGSKVVLDIDLSYEKGQEGEYSSRWTAILPVGWIFAEIQPRGTYNIWDYTKSGLKDLLGKLSVVEG